jgi:hypothetical protein
MSVEATGCFDIGLTVSSAIRRFEETGEPYTDSPFKFDAMLEFAYLSDFWTLPGVHPYGEPAKGRKKVQKDAEKIGRYLAGGACRAGYVIIFEDCDWGFPEKFVSDAERNQGCRVRFVRSY